MLEDIIKLTALWQWQKQIIGIINIDFNVRLLSWTALDCTGVPNKIKTYHSGISNATRTKR